MKIIVWGCRGSITSPGPTTIRYGGESTCIEVITDDGRETIIDAGSGIRKLGQKIVHDRLISTINLLFTHSHWDHLAGFPFFQPAYRPDFSFSLCGGGEPQRSVLNYLAHQMDPPYFPVNFNELKAKFSSGCCCNKAECNHSFQYADRSTSCSAIPLNHPNGGYGFKLTGKTGSFVFLPDNEIQYSHKGGLSRDEYVEFCRNTTLLFHDAQYLDSEYETTRGWGHSTIKDAVDLALDAGVRQLGLFHHDPDRTDDELDALVDWCRQYIKSQNRSLECFACAEGMELIV
ncbi:MAG: MBL fold metallo-hydrolase [Bacteroidota bacterium]